MFNSFEFTTESGFPIVTHFESHDDEAALEARTTKERLEQKMRDDVKEMGLDTGPLHFLYNSERRAQFMTESQFAEWQSAPPDWFHRSGFIEELLETIIGLDSKGSIFEGPTQSQINKYIENEAAMALNEEDLNCRLCLVPTGLCPVRSASFDEAELEKAIAEYLA